MVVLWLVKSVAIPECVSVIRLGMYRLCACLCVDLERSGIPVCICTLFQPNFLELHSTHFQWMIGNSDGYGWIGGGVTQHSRLSVCGFWFGTSRVPFAFCGSNMWWCSVFFGNEWVHGYMLMSNWFAEQTLPRWNVCGRALHKKTCLCDLWAFHRADLCQSRI